MNVCISRTKTNQDSNFSACSLRFTALFCAVFQLYNTLRMLVQRLLLGQLPGSHAK